MLFSNTSCNSYENMVKRRMEKEGKNPEEFSVGSRAWGTRVGNSPFIEHNDKYYLEVFFISPGKTYYTVDGKETDKDLIEGLPESKPASEESQGGIEDKVIIRTFSVDSIQRIRMKNQEIQ
jgi:hypothetical protein